MISLFAVRLSRFAGAWFLIYHRGTETQRKLSHIYSVPLCLLGKSLRLARPILVALLPHARTDLHQRIVGMGGAHRFLQHGERFVVLVPGGERRANGGEEPP